MEILFFLGLESVPCGRMCVIDWYVSVLACILRQASMGKMVGSFFFIVAYSLFFRRDIVVNSQVIEIQNVNKGKKC